MNYDLSSKLSKLSTNIYPRAHGKQQKHNVDIPVLIPMKLEIWLIKDMFLFKYFFLPFTGEYISQLSSQMS